MTSRRPADVPAQRVAAVRPDPLVAARPATSSRWRRLAFVAAEVAAVVVFYLLYAYARDLHGAASMATGAGADLARTHGLDVLHAEQALGIDIELPAQRWALQHPGLLRVLDGFYGAAHFPVTAGVLLWLLLARPRAVYRRWRSVLALGTLAAIAVFILFPTMPPRLLPPEHGYVDTLAVVGGFWSYNGGVVEHISDPFAAMPSLHLAWSTWCACALVAANPGRRWRWIYALYPIVTVLAVVVTGNHWVLDLVAGAALVPLAMVGDRVVRALYERFRHLLGEVARFGVVGAANTVIDIGLFNVLLLSVLHGSPLKAKAISLTVAATSSYFMNRHWTWRDRARTGVGREYVLFIVLSAVGLAINEACLGFSHYVLGLQSHLADNISANVVGLGLATVWRFWSFKRWVFLAPEETAQAAEEAVV